MKRIGSFKISTEMLLNGQFYAVSAGIRILSMEGDGLTITIVAEWEIFDEVDEDDRTPQYEITGSRAPGLLMLKAIRNE